MRDGFVFIQELLRLFFPQMELIWTRKFNSFFIQQHRVHITWQEICWGIRQAEDFFILSRILSDGSQLFWFPWVFEKFIVELPMP